MAIRRAQAKKQHAHQASGLASVAGYVLFYPVFVWFVLWALPTDKKKDAIAVLHTAIEWMYNTIQILHPETVRLMGQLFFLAAMLIGAYTMMLFEYRRFRRTKSFTVPLIDKWVPAIANWFYDEQFAEADVSLKNVKGKAVHLAKELDNAKKRSAALEQEKSQIAQELGQLVTLSDGLRLRHDNYVDANAELVRLMEHVAHVVEQTDPGRHQKAFSEVMDEIANTVTRVTSDKKNDKYSCIMLVDDQQQRMVIIGCNGLTLASRARTFAKGQGFAGWIWENGQHDVCDDVTQDGRFQQPGYSPNGPYRSMIGVPIFSSQRTTIGALFVQSRRAAAFNREEDVAILTNFALLVSICLSDLLRRQRG